MLPLFSPSDPSSQSNELFQRPPGYKTRPLTLNSSTSPRLYQSLELSDVDSVELLRSAHCQLDRSSSRCSNPLSLDIAGPEDLYIIQTRKSKHQQYRPNDPSTQHTTLIMELLCCRPLCCRSTTSSLSKQLLPTFAP